MGVLIKRERDPGKRIHKEKAMSGHSEKIAICKPGREASGETELAITLILDFQAPEL